MSGRSAAALLRSTGLAPMGPVVWGTAPTSDVPGVYAVEAPEPFTVAPIDAQVVAAWIDRVPTLRLDGTRPDAGALAARLAEFWHPGEAVVRGSGEILNHATSFIVRRHRMTLR